MKTDIHPSYVESSVRCSCGNTFTTRSTKPEIHLELCNECHPFFTGKQKLVDSGGRVERFQRRYAKTGSRKKKAPPARLLSRGAASRAGPPHGVIRPGRRGRPATPGPVRREAPDGWALPWPGVQRTHERADGTSSSASTRRSWPSSTTRTCPSDPSRLRQVSRRHRELEEPVQTWRRLVAAGVRPRGGPGDGAATRPVTSGSWPRPR